MMRRYCGRADLRRAFPDMPEFRVDVVQEGLAVMNCPGDSRRFDLEKRFQAALLEGLLSRSD
jgi:hypothetical protein